MLSVIFSSTSFAAFTLNGTRFIYEEGQNNIPIEITNKSKQNYGGQVWVENINQPVSDVYFTPTPTFFRLNSNQKQLVRLLNINNALPKDRESLFWLNVQEIPPAQKKGSNALAIALNTKVKLFWRPKGLINHREEAEQQLSINGQILKNPTPYYFAITSIKINGKAISLTHALNRKLSMLAPFSQINLGEKLSGKITIEAIDDYGARREYILK